VGTCCTPLPVREIVVGEFVALLTTETDPVSAPDAVGVKTTLNVALAPAAMVSGTVTPVVLKPVPEAVILETFTLELPVLVSVTVCVLLLPTFTFPKLRLVTLGASCSVAATPVPLIAIVLGEFGALLTSETLPVTAPALAGENATLKVVLCPGVSVRGRVRPLTAKVCTETVACETDRFAVPEFVNLMA
jgi:hypothetical protein